MDIRDDGAAAGGLRRDRVERAVIAWLRTLRVPHAAAPVPGVAPGLLAASCERPPRLEARR